MLPFLTLRTTALLCCTATTAAVAMVWGCSVRLHWIGRVWWPLGKLYIRWYICLPAGVLYAENNEYGFHFTVSYFNALINFNWIFFLRTFFKMCFLFIIYLVLFEWMNELCIYIYICIVVHPKRFTIMWGGLSSTTTSVQHPLGWCDGCHTTTAVWTALFKWIKKKCICFT